MCERGRSDLAIMSDFCLSPIAVGGNTYWCEEPAQHFWTGKKTKHHVKSRWFEIYWGR